jgi:2-hydroxy-6-oxonona-2,4-dienedioate hydrolase
MEKEEDNFKSSFEKVKFQKLENNETLSYREYNNLFKDEQKTLILIHGNPGSALIFDILLGKLSKEYRIISIDLRGYANSTYNTPIISLEDYANDIYLFLKQLNIIKCSLLGWSLGASIVLTFAGLFPDLTEKVISIAAVKITGKPVYLPPNSTTIRATTKKEAFDNAYYVREYTKVLNQKDRNYVSQLMLSLFENTPENLEKYIDEVMLQRSYADIQYALNRMNMTNEEFEGVEGSGLLSKITSKVLIISCENDLISPFKEGEILIEHLINAKYKVFYVFKNVGHNPIFDCTDEFVKVINNFLLNLDE